MRKTVLIALLSLILSCCSAQWITGAASFTSSSCASLPYLVRATYTPTCTAVGCSAGSATTCFNTTNIGAISLPTAVQVVSINYYPTSAISCLNQTVVNNVPRFSLVYPLGIAQCGPVASDYRPTAAYTYAYAKSCQVITYCTDAACSAGCADFTLGYNTSVSNPTCFSWFGPQAQVTAQCFTASAAPVTPTTTNAATSATTTPATTNAATTNAATTNNAGTSGTTTNSTSASTSSTTGSSTTTNGASSVAVGALFVAVAAFFSL